MQSSLYLKSQNVKEYADFYKSSNRKNKGMLRIVSVGVMAIQKGVYLLSLFFLFVVSYGIFEDVLKGLYISFSLCLLNNLKPCFKGIEGVLGYHA